MHTTVEALEFPGLRACQRITSRFFGRQPGGRISWEMTVHPGGDEKARRLPRTWLLSDHTDSNAKYNRARSKTGPDSMATWSKFGVSISKRLTTFKA
jgi:hypothetical protein